MWFYQYKILTTESSENPPIEKLVYRSGLVPAKTFKEATNVLAEYYGEDHLIEICGLKPVFETLVEFQDANKESYFDYRIHPKKRRK